jgi:hypothetical protein
MLSISARLRPWLIGLAVACAGCATPKMPTASGRPEVTIKATADEVRNALAGDLLNRGYRYEKPAGQLCWARKTRVWQPRFFSERRISSRRLAPGSTSSLWPDGQVRVVGFLSMTQVGLFHDREDNLTSARINAEMQYALECIKADLEHKPRPDAPVLPPITKAESPREKAR